MRHYVVAVATLTARDGDAVLVAPNERMFEDVIVGRHHDPFTVMRQFVGAPAGVSLRLITVDTPSPSQYSPNPRWTVEHRQSLDKADRQLSDGGRDQ
jgi:hypothetical protein